MEGKAKGNSCKFNKEQEESLLDTEILGVEEMAVSVMKLWCSGKLGLVNNQTHFLNFLSLWKQHYKIPS